MSHHSEDPERLQDPDFLSKSALLFKLRDLRALKVNFRSTMNEKDVIPDRNVDFPREYVISNLHRAELEKRDFDLNRLSNNDVKAFVNTLHTIVMNAGIDIGTSESHTDSLVADLLFCVLAFHKWPLTVALHPTYKFAVGEVVVSAKADFVISNQTYFVLVVEDKHLVNVRPTNDYGEPQVLAEMLACGEENIRLARRSYNMIMFSVRVISTYVTFYRTTINKEYWDELGDGCPRQQSLTIFRWPGNSSDPFEGFDLAEPDGRRSVLEALCKIRHYLLNSD
ncbi:hypothetical protein F8M41_006496 [Gigaspora margarita]|uniref:Uncharacterized protein n=1 Tax=Gigaspora margarita TaxID=4874 RepID=A0A8H4A579_GIGMA|nr:hypothetical protein F8M41_006496 [Gigaspora margarita]